jgi:hypothetical protein
MPGIHVFFACQDADGRDKPGHDVERKRVTQISAGRRQPDARFLQCDSVSETLAKVGLAEENP